MVRGGKREKGKNITLEEADILFFFAPFITKNNTSISKHK